jgi:adenylate cyclase class 2
MEEFRSKSVNFRIEIPFFYLVMSSKNPTKNMKPTLVEIKAKCAEPEKIAAKLKALNARFIGIDHQIDTYFQVPNGRLKLRQGSIENHLIFYSRNNQAGPKQSNVMLYKPQESDVLREILATAVGEKVVVNKQRQIYFIDNVKFHIDIVKGLGSFMEIEAIDEKGTIGTARLHEQCTYYMNLLNVKTEDLIENSYSDMILETH